MTAKGMAVEADVRRGGRLRPHPVAELRAATALLTRLPVGAGALAADRTGSAAFALVGAGIGLAAGIPAVLLAATAPLLGAMLALAVAELASGMLHLDGLADTADALAAPDPARAEAARKDPRTGSAGVGAIVLVLGSAAGAILAIPPGALLACLVVAGAASRAVPAIAAPLLGRDGRDAAGGSATGFGAWFAARAGRGGALAALLTTLVVAGAGGAATHTVLPVAATLAGLAAGLATAAVLRRRFGQLAGDFLGASVEIGFAGALAAAAVGGGFGQ